MEQSLVCACLPLPAPQPNCYAGRSWNRINSIAGNAFIWPIRIGRGLSKCEQTVPAGWLLSVIYSVISQVTVERRILVGKLRAGFRMHGSRLICQAAKPTLV